jgi:hypothetical protein
MQKDSTSEMKKVLAIQLGLKQPTFMPLKAKALPTTM